MKRRMSLDITGETDDNLGMSPGIRDRFRRLAGYDRLLLLLTGGLFIVGILDNYFRVHDPMHRPFWSLSLMILEAAILGVVAYSVIRHQRRPTDYGFSFKTGGVVSLGILVVVHVYLVISGKLLLSATTDPRARGNFLWAVLFVLMEELVVRAIWIDKFILLMDGIPNKAFWAILASSVLWSLAHIPSLPPSQVVGGIFLGGLLFGYVYYKSRSILLPVWIHGVANAGYLGGILLAAVYCLISVADFTIPSWNRPTVPSAIATRES